jgi:ABC-type multidrug transport system ATPase subunit
MDTIVVEELTKRFGPVLAVDRLSFAVGAGRVTGFLGPNGAGKTTTIRTLLGLVHPTSGSATVNGLRYADLPNPARTVGAVLEATSFHPGRRARDHLRILAAAARLPASRVDDTLAVVGLADAGRRRVGGFSLGMRQRLGLAATDLEVTVDREGALVVSGATPDAVGRAVAQAGLALYEMRPIEQSLEDVFFQLTTSREGSRP